VALNPVFLQFRDPRRKRPSNGDTLIPRLSAPAPRLMAEQGATSGFHRMCLLPILDEPLELDVRQWVIQERVTTDGRTTEGRTKTRARHGGTKSGRPPALVNLIFRFVRAESVSVFWWFEREGAYTRCEVLDLPTGGFELRIVNHDGTEQVEHFSNVAELAKRQEAVNAQLRNAGWVGPHGWVI
jgi:hypothetical protein